MAGMRKPPCPMEELTRTNKEQRAVMPFLSKEIHDEHLKGYVITDCAVREKTIVYFCLRKVVSDAKVSMTWDHDIETRFLVVNLAEGATPWGLRTLIGYNKPRIGIALKPLHQGLLVARNLDGQVSVLGGGAKFPDEFIDPRKNPSTWKIKTIDGYAYSVGGSRNVYKRVDLGTWVKLDPGIPKLDYSSDNGFDDLDAFDEADMYAVGGMGDVWHFNGQSWRQMAFPRQVPLTTVTCAADGWVYITSLGGLWRGRESTGGDRLRHRCERRVLVQRATVAGIWLQREHLERQRVGSVHARRHTQWRTRAPVRRPHGRTRRPVDGRQP